MLLTPSTSPPAGAHSPRRAAVRPSPLPPLCAPRRAPEPKLKCCLTATFGGSTIRQLLESAGWTLPSTGARAPNSGGTLNCSLEKHVLHNFQANLSDILLLNRTLLNLYLKTNHISCLNRIGPISKEIKICGFCDLNCYCIKMKIINSISSLGSLGLKEVFYLTNKQNDRLKFL